MLSVMEVFLEEEVLGGGPGRTGGALFCERRGIGVCVLGAVRGESVWQGDRMGYTWNAGVG